MACQTFLTMEAGMKRSVAITVGALLCFLSSCAIFVYDDDASCDKDGSGDTLTIIFSQSSSPVGP
jgi:hypothetical protein